MPFQGEKRPFNRKDVMAFPGFKAGVYGIFKDNGALIIGSSGDIKARVMRHVNGDNVDLTASQPNFWAAEPVSGGQAALDARQKQLVDEYKPPLR